MLRTTEQVLAASHKEVARRNGRRSVTSFLDRESQPSSFWRTAPRIRGLRLLNMRGQRSVRLFLRRYDRHQETFTDPSYHRQIIVMTAPFIISNTIVNHEDPSRIVYGAPRVSWSRSRPSRLQLALTGELEDDLIAQQIVGISDIDTHVNPSPAGPWRARRHLLRFSPARWRRSEEPGGAPNTQGNRGG
ncbi:MAG: carbamoyl-phosphate synthase domain-containing protein [Ancrocorticia sp.]